jgi:small subunit ribosomal protein S20
MANSKSALKRVQTNERNRLRNQAYRSSVRTAVKRVHTLLESNAAADELQGAFNKAQCLIHRAVSKNIYKKNKGARDISRLAGAISRQQNASA